MKTAIYPGSFDPITNGHLDIMRRALKVFDKLVIAVAKNPEKVPLFSVTERIAMIRESTKGLAVEIDHFEGLLIEYVQQQSNLPVVRGLRAVSNFEQEFMLAVMNRKLNADFETVFFMTDKEYFYLSSSLIKQVARNKGNLNGLVPPAVEKKLREKFLHT